MPDVRFLTVREACVKLRMNEGTVGKLLKKGFLTGFRIPCRGHSLGMWRIVDPGDKFEAYLEKLESPIVTAPILTSAEAAAVIGISHGNLRQLVLKKQLRQAKPAGPGHVSMFTVDEVRRYIWKKEKRSRQGRRQVALKQVIRWARALIDKDLEGTAAPIAAVDELHTELQEILKLQEPARSESLRMFWEKLDDVSVLISAVRDDSVARDAHVDAADVLRDIDQVGETVKPCQ